MAAIYTKHKLIVMQMPKTGCVWRTHALRDAGIGPLQQVDLPPGHDRRHAVLSQIPNRYLNYRKIGCVRRPDNWLRSWWMMRMQRNNWSGRWPTWMPDVFFDRDCKSADFPTFVERYLELYPGFLTRLTNDYIGQQGGRVDFVCRVETLVADLSEALSALEIPYNQMALNNCGKINAGREKWKSLASFPNELRARVFEAESTILDTFYPELSSHKNS